MTTPFNLDPFDMWRQAVTKMEEGINTLGNQSLKSDEFSKALMEFSTVSMQMQHVLEKALGRYFKAINLPSRKEFMELAETLRRVEEKLDRLMPASELPPRPRPARTRQPAALATVAQPTAAQSAAAQRAESAEAARARSVLLASTPAPKRKRIAARKPKDA